jgi:hypothetical protein
MPPVEAVVHSVALLPLAAVVLRRRCVPPVAIVVPPIEVDCRVIGRCPPLFVAVAARPPPLVRRPPPSYRAAAASLLIVAPPPPSVNCRVIRPARCRRCAACCPAAPCRHHAAR